MHLMFWISWYSGWILAASEAPAGDGTPGRLTPATSGRFTAPRPTAEPPDRLDATLAGDGCAEDGALEAADDGIEMVSPEAPRKPSSTGMFRRVTVYWGVANGVRTRTMTCDHSRGRHRNGTKQCNCRCRMRYLYNAFGWRGVAFVGCRRRGVIQWHVYSDFTTG
jgi:hypothetical protein